MRLLGHTLEATDRTPRPSLSARLPGETGINHQSQITRPRWLHETDVYFKVLCMLTSGLISRFQQCEYQVGFPTILTVGAWFSFFLNCRG